MSQRITSTDPDELTDDELDHLERVTQLIRGHRRRYLYFLRETRSRLRALNLAALCGVLEREREADFAPRQGPPTPIRPRSEIERLVDLVVADLRAYNRTRKPGQPKAPTSPKKIRRRIRRSQAAQVDYTPALHA